MGEQSMTLYSRLLFVEAWMKGVQHLSINASIIKIFQQTYPAHEIHFFADKSHLNAIKSQLKEVHTHRVYLTYYSVFTMPFFDFCSIFPVLRVLLRSNKRDVVILTNRLPLAHLTYNLLNRCIRRPTIILMHGEMEAIVNPKNVGKTRYYFFLNKYAIKISGSQTRYVIFGESIKNKIQHVISLADSKILCIDHPIKDVPTIVPQSHHPIHLAFVGRAVRQKNAQLLFQLADALQNEILTGKISIEIIGMADEDILPSNGREKVSFPQGGNLLSESLFREKIQKTHFILCFLDNNSYQAIPSGTFMDTLMYEKPILALTGNSFVEYYFSRFPMIGQRYCDIEEMSSGVKGFLSDDFQEKYSTYVDHIKEAKQEFTFDQLSKKLKKQLLLFPFKSC